MKQLTLTMKVQMFINDKSNVKYIKYDHDCGHSYSYIDHPLLNEVEGTELESEMYTWLYDNDDLPPCEDRCDCGN